MVFRAVFCTDNENEFLQHIVGHIINTKTRFLCSSLTNKPEANSSTEFTNLTFNYWFIELYSTIYW